MTFTIAIFVLGLAAFGGGLMRRAGPRRWRDRRVLYGPACFASFTRGRLWLHGSHG